MLPVLPAAYPPIICDYIQLVCCGYLVNQTAKQVVQRVLLAVQNVGGNQALVCQSYYDQIFFVLVSLLSLCCFVGYKFAITCIPVDHQHKYGSDANDIGLQLLDRMLQMS